MLEEDDSDDSLDLLLDTLCNAFGGIILITLLIALMSQEAHDSSLAPKSFRTQVLLEDQRIAKIDGEIEIEESMTLALPDANVSDSEEKAMALAREKAKLEKQREETNADISRFQRRLASIPTNSTNLAKDLENRKRELTERNQALTGRNGQLRSAIEESRGVLNESNAAIGEAKRERTEHLRLPKEKKDKGKGYLWILVKHGKVYPCHHPDKEQMFTITESTTPLGRKVYWHKPKMDQGFDPSRHRASLAAYFRTVKPRTEYLAFRVFVTNDCFKAFNEAKRLATDMKIGYSWKPIDDVFGLTSVGESGGPEL
jgi:hypothetical protein